MPVHQVQGSSYECLIDYTGQNGEMCHSQWYGAPMLDGGPHFSPQAPERSTSSREAVQRGLSTWHQYDLVDDPFFGSNGGLPRFPASGGAPRQDVEQSIEVLNKLMLELEPSNTRVTKSQYAPPGENSTVFQPAFAQTLDRPSYQADLAIRSFTGGPPLSSSVIFGQSSQKSSPAYTMAPPSELHQRGFQSPHAYSTIYQQDPYSVCKALVTTPSPTLPVPSPIKPQHVSPLSGEVPYPPDLQGTYPYSSPQRSCSASPSPFPTVTPAKEPETKSEEETLKLEGLVAHRVAGSRSPTVTPDEAMPNIRRRTTSESQYLNNRNDSPAHGVCSPEKSISPEFVNTIAVNPGGRPKERQLHSSREPFEVVEFAPISPTSSYGGETQPLTPAFPVSPNTSPQTPYFKRCRSPTGLAKNSLSALKAQSPAEPLVQQSSSERPVFPAYNFDPPKPVNSASYNPDSNIWMGNPVLPIGGQHILSSFPSEAIQAPLFPDPIGYLDPKEATVNIMGVHHVPGSPNTLHRTVATNTPPSPALQRRLGGQSSPALGRHIPPASGTPNSPLLGRNGKFIPPSPVLNRYSTPVPVASSLDHKPTPSGQATPDERVQAQSRQSTTSIAQHGSPTPTFPLEHPCRPSHFLPLDKRTVPIAENPDSVLEDISQNGKAPTRTPTPVWLSMTSTTPQPPQEPAIMSIYADGPPDIRLNVKFVQDTSKFWYKPEISREQAICLLKDREPGAFVIRDSNSFRGAYGLAMKVASPPPTVQQNKMAGDITNELVRHFLIETSAKGVRLKGCPNEPYFGCLSALVYQHSITPLALPCKLMIPTRDPREEAMDLATQTSSTLDLLKQGAGPPKPNEGFQACNVLYINSVDVESLTGPQAVAKAITETLTSNSASLETIVRFKVSTKGITLTDNQRKIFFRRHYPINTITYCNVDPQNRKWNKAEGGVAKLFGFVARKQGSTTDNVSHLFAELEPDQPVTDIVHFVSKVMPDIQKL
ncbi:tensin isoform X2 [Myxocyprinus asiaticus]|uniref:tensin isoform X2 n=1 Tax=Myxocyprinus asiaticus TaxID=70543 RepID=UPI002223C7A8|nr:tensin isoform X2 [Myxocyprinus asiaticus]